LRYGICFWAMLFVSEPWYLFLSHVICFLPILFISETCYLFLSHIICFWAMSFVSEPCYFSLLQGTYCAYNSPAPQSANFFFWSA
jgi:hypothetical protein